MNYLPQLTEDEVCYICSVIPLHDSINYFQKNPKEFAKIMPGFRAKSMNQDQVSTLLFRYHNQNFISFFIEKHISKWLSQIQKHISKMIKDGDSKESALLHTPPLSYFAGNVGLFFKLINEEYSVEYIALLSAAVTAIKEASDQQNKLQEELKFQKFEIKNFQAQLDSAKKDLTKSGIKLNEYNAEIKALQHDLADLDNLKSTVKKDKEIIKGLEAKIQVQEEIINGLRNELAEAKKSSQQIEAQIKDELKKQIAATSEQQTSVRPKHPSDIEDFKDFLGYNLQNIGVPTDSEYYTLLKEHLSKILFRGIPIVINRGAGTTILKCIVNALIGQSNIKGLTFSNDLSISNIDSFLSTAGRVACLDNFIGNYNETELLSLFDCHRDKIIFLTVAYDRTIHYVSKEFLRYCQYLNLNRIAALSSNAELTEDPSTIKEIEYKPQGIYEDNRYSSLLREILGEFGFLQSLVEQKCTTISDEQDLCRSLAFDVLPYCVDVMQITPYNTSERFNKYAGAAGRCPYKNLFKGWFAR